VYQYFGEEEREEIDERIDEESYKVSGTDIATKTQLFTPRYIVEWMVDNSLGRTWLEMQGKRTNIDEEENCFYLAPLTESLVDRESKSVEEITVLDPACGSGHMLFYAFDVLYQMYLEEGEIPEEYIPREILKNNLYGVDIDSGAAKTAALSLYLKAKEHSPHIKIPQINIVSADTVLINGERKNEILERTRSDVEEKILRQIWNSFDNLREFGSLIHVEERVDNILEEQREELEATGQAKFTKEGSLATQSSFVSSEGETESWDRVKDRLLDEIRKLASDALEHSNPIEEMFADEVEKSIRLLDIIVRDYSVVLSNPPYLTSKKMGDELKNFLKDSYTSSANLYSAFIERCIELSEEDGYTAMVTPDTFKYQYSYRGLRKDLASSSQIIDAVHLARYGFSNQKDRYVIPFVLQNQDPDQFDKSRFYRLTHEQEEYKDYNLKVSGLERVTKKLRQKGDHKDVYVVDQKDFLKIEKTPFVYYLGQDILTFLTTEEQLSQNAELKTWLDTQGNDDKFIRRWWEVAPESGNNWVRLVTNGDGEAFYESIVNRVLWNNDGEEVKSALSSSPRNEDWYFTEGVNYRYFSNYFCARYMPEDTIFGKNTIGVFLDDNDDIYWTISYLNSTLVRYIAFALSPGLRFEKGDGGRIPFPTLEDQTRNLLSNIAQSQIELRKELAKTDETKSEFSLGEVIRKSSSKGLYKILLHEDLARADLLVGEGIVDTNVWESVGASSKSIQAAHDRFRPNFSEFPIRTEDVEDSRYSTHLDDNKTVCQNEYVDEIQEIVETKEIDDIEEISEELEVSPVTVSKIRFENSIYTDEELEDAAGQIISYALGILLGRWKKNGSQEHILSLRNDKSINQIESKISELFGDSSNIVASIQNALGRGIEDWLNNRFFRYHHTKEYRRRGQRIPVYWQLESPDGAFSCLIYYHKIDMNTLPKLRGQYLDPRIGELENELETLNAQTSGENPDKDLLNRKEEVQDDLEDVKEFRETIDEMIDDGVTVDVEKGIWENIKEWDQYEVLETGLPKLKSSYSR
jgi:hypothetical protein